MKLNCVINYLKLTNVLYYRPSSAANYWVIWYKTLGSGYYYYQTHLLLTAISESIGNT